MVNSNPAASCHLGASCHFQKVEWHEGGAPQSLLFLRLYGRDVLFVPLARTTRALA